MSKTLRVRREGGEPPATNARGLLGPLSSHELARRCKLDPSHVSRILRGERKPSIGAARILAAALDMTVGEFVESIDFGPGPE